MGIEQPGLVVLAALFAALGLYLLTKGPTVWGATALLPLFPIVMCLFWLDQVLKGVREGFDLSMIATLTIAIAIVPAIVAVREYRSPSESWSTYNASRSQVIAALERALQTHAIPFDWHRKRLRLPTVGIGGSTLVISRWFGSIGIEVNAADRDERRVVAQTVLPLLREELSTLPRPIIPGSGVFFLAWGALMLVGATQLPKLFR